jgi:hypothetical protein
MGKKTLGFFETFFFFYQNKVALIIFIFFGQPG